MPPVLAIGDRAYSSWSLRGWLLFDAFGIGVEIRRARLYSPQVAELLAEFAPARTVPAARMEDGSLVMETIAIAEELASRYPQAGIWPADPRARAVARSLVAEMHAGFGALRNHCPMNLRVSHHDIPLPEAVARDLERLEVLWSWAKTETGGDWLCGAYSAADAFFAPVVGRIAGYGLPVGPVATAYVEMALAHPSFRRWRAMALVDGPDQEFYRRDWPTRPWPGPAPLPAEAAEAGPSLNATCPYSGLPVTHFLTEGGRVWGFCNAFCRDKTMADPLAWPAFAALREASLGEGHR